MQDKLTHYGTTLLRVSFGTLLLAHGVLKLKVFTIAGTVGFFEKVGVPMAELAAYGTIAFEIIGGLLLLAGVLVRLVSLASVPVMLGAIIYVHGANGWLFSNQGGGWEFPAFLAVIGLVQALLGRGAFALNIPGLPARLQHA